MHLFVREMKDQPQHSYQNLLKAIERERLSLLPLTLLDLENARSDIDLTPSKIEAYPDTDSGELLT